MLSAILIFIIATFFTHTPLAPKNTSDICAVFQQHPSWQQSALKASKRWGVPTSVLMAIMEQESHFNAVARPARKRIWWIIPWQRPSSAYGYSQALDAMWKQYQRQTQKPQAARDVFDDAVDFMGWYVNNAYQSARISKLDVYAAYLVYHEGSGSYLRKEYLTNQKLINAANKVRFQEVIYREQLERC